MYAFRATATGTTGKVRATFTTPVNNAAIDVISLSGNSFQRRANDLGVHNHSERSGRNRLE
jgi:hypothetical protein